MNCPTDTSTLRRSLYRATAGLAFLIASCSVAAPVSAQSCDCGCEVGACDALVADGCDCETHGPSKRRMSFDMRKTPVYKTLDLLAGGIEKALRLDEDSDGTCDDGFESCDDACDAAMLMELSAPLPSLPMPLPQPMHVHSHPTTSYRAGPPAPAPAPANRVIRPAPVRQTMPRVPAPVMPAPLVEQPVQPESTLVPAPIESLTPSTQQPKTVTPFEAPESNGLRQISRPNVESSDDSSPVLPAPIIDRGQIPFPSETTPADSGDSTNPFLDDPFQSTPLGRRSVGSGLRPVQYQRTNATARRPAASSQNHQPTTKRKTSRNPKSNRGGMFR